MRKEYSAFKDVDIEYLYDYNNPKVLHYVKKKDDEIYHVLINCSKDDIPVNKCEKVLIANRFENEMLQSDGVVVYKEK